MHAFKCAKQKLNENFVIKLKFAFVFFVYVSKRMVDLNTR